MSKHTLILYYVPEDKDDPEFPNAFGMNLAQEDIKLRDIKGAFPLQGEYQFRFKYKINGQAVWMDLPSETSGLPLFNGKVFMRASRVSWENDLERPEPHSANEEYKKDYKSSLHLTKQRSQSQPHNQEAHHHQPQQQPKPSLFSNNDFDLLGSDTSAKPQSKASENNPKATSYANNLLEDYGDSQKQEFIGNQTKAPQKSNNLMEFDADLV